MDDSLWDDGDPESWIIADVRSAVRETEWTRMSSEFTNAGYREGITAGKEAAVQEGFDAGFADVGVPLGREIGQLRGRASAALAFLIKAKESNPFMPEILVDEAREINADLGNVRYSDIEPRDEEAERHAREHLEVEGEEMERVESVEERPTMEGVEDMLAGLGVDEKGKKQRPTMEDVGMLKLRLEVLVIRIGLSGYNQEDAVL